MTEETGAQKPKARWRVGHSVTVYVLLTVAAITWRYWGRSADPAVRWWMTVVRDTSYTIFIDSSRVEARVQWALLRPVKAYSVWYRTDHKLPRPHGDKPFDREVVHSVIWCDSLWYKVLSVDMSMGEHLPIARQVTDLHDQEWRRVERGGTDERAARNACLFARERRP